MFSYYYILDDVPRPTSQNGTSNQLGTALPASNNTGGINNGQTFPPNRLGIALLQVTTPARLLLKA